MYPFLYGIHQFDLYKILFEFELKLKSKLNLIGLDLHLYQIKINTKFTPLANRTIK